MSTVRILLATFLAPERALPAAERASPWPPLLVATALSLLLAAALAPRIDYAAGALAELDKDPQATALLSPHDRTAKLEQAAKVGAFLAYAKALALPALRAGGVALALALGFWLAGTPAALLGAFRVASYGLLPLALRDLLSLPAALRAKDLPPGAAGGLFPSALARLLSPAAPPPLVHLAEGLDLFALWAVVLLALGMAEVAGASRRRALGVLLALWVFYLLGARVALPGLWRAA